MIASTPVLNWVNHRGAWWQADLGDHESYRIFPVTEPHGYELWLWRSQARLGEFSTLAEAKAAAKTHVGDDEQEGP